MIGLGLVGIGILILCIGSIMVRQNKNYPVPRQKKDYKFAILIPARNESRVIEGLLRSIMLQTYKIDMNDVYVVVEDKKDKTVEITKRLGANIFVRKHLDLRRKGYALDEVVKDILKKKKHYDAYFVMDADNILAPNFIEKMSESYQKGYDMAIGYRNCKNGNDSVIAACSALTFALINARGNLEKNKQTRNVIISGTGFFVNGSLVESWGGWPFHSLTEDYEMSMYAVTNNYTSYYNNEAVFYDEQPIYYGQTVPQRVRWIRGFFDSRHIYMKQMRKRVHKKHKNWGSQIGELIGINPYIMMVVGAILIILFNLFQFGFTFIVSNRLVWQYLIHIGIVLLIAYLAMAIVTWSAIWKEKTEINLSKKMRIKAVLFNPLFFTTYIPCFFEAMLTKEVTWEPVEHTRNIIVEDR